MSDTNDPRPVYIEVHGTVYQAYTKRGGIFDCNRCDLNTGATLKGGCKSLGDLNIRDVCTKMKWIWQGVVP